MVYEMLGLCNACERLTNCFIDVSRMVTSLHSPPGLDPVWWTFF